MTDMFKIDPDIYGLADGRVQALRTGELTQLEFMRLTRPEDPWEIRAGTLVKITPEMQAEQRLWHLAARQGMMRQTGGLAGTMVVEHAEAFQEAYPELRQAIGQAVAAVQAKNCHGCAVNSEMGPVLQALLQAPPEGRDVSALERAGLPAAVLQRLAGREVEVDPASMQYPPQLDKDFSVGEVSATRAATSREGLVRLRPPYEVFWAAAGLIKAAYPSVAPQIEAAEARIGKDKCPDCVKQKYRARIMRALKAAQPAGEVPAELQRLLDSNFQDTAAVRAVPRAAAAPLGQGPRPSCLECVCKHIAQAVVLLGEAALGYPHHKWLAVGHLAEASEEALGSHPALAAEIRTRRLAVMASEGDWPPLMDLFDMAAAEGGN